MGDLVRRFVPMGQRRLVDPSAWTPAAVPGCILYGGAYQEARATRAAQPNLLDGACEDVSKWNSHAGATLTNQPGGVSGNCMRVAFNGSANPMAGQYIGIVGNRYRATGWFRGDGTKPPEVFVFNSLALGLASNDWQSFAADQTMGASGILGLRCTTAAAGYAEFDSITLANLSLQSYTPAYTTIPGSVLAQATATAQPWVSSDGLGIRYQGGDLLQWSAAASAVKCLHDGTGGTLIVAVRLSTLAADATFAATSNNVVNTSTGAFLYAGASGALYIVIGNGSGTGWGLSASAAGAIVAGQTYVLTLRSAAGVNGVTVRKNGVNVITGTITAPSAADSNTGIVFGARTAGAAGIDGVLGHPFVANRVLTDAECTQVENYILAQATL